MILKLARTVTYTRKGNYSPQRRKEKKNQEEPKENVPKRNRRMVLRGPRHVTGSCAASSRDQMAAASDRTGSSVQAQDVLLPLRGGPRPVAAPCFVPESALGCAETPGPFSGHWMHGTKVGGGRRKEGGRGRWGKRWASSVSSSATGLLPWFLGTNVRRRSRPS